MIFVFSEPLQVFAEAKPSITKQPVGTEAAEGEKVSFKVTAKGTKLKYQWYIKVKGGSWKKMTQTSYSTVPSVNIELGNQCSKHTDEACKSAAKALLAGIESYYAGK